MKKQKGKSPSASAVSVWKYWFCQGGWERWKEADQRLGTRITSKMISIDHDYPMCWACHTPRSKWSSLERCHIIPKSSGGAGDASNLILMCRMCHLESPTVNHSDALFIFLSRKKTRAEVYQEELRDIIKNSKLSVVGLAIAWKHALSDDSMVCGGATISPAAWMSLLRAKVADLESDESLCGDVTYDDWKKTLYLLEARLIDLELNQGICNPDALKDNQ